MELRVLNAAEVDRCLTMRDATALMRNAHATSWDTVNDFSTLQLKDGMRVWITLFNDPAFNVEFEKAKEAGAEVKNLALVEHRIKLAKDAHAKALEAAEAKVKEDPSDDNKKALEAAKVPFVPMIAVDQLGTEKMTDEALKKEIDDKTAAKGELGGKIAETGRSTLRVASALPIIMAIAFILIIIYYKSIGGYKPVVLASGGGSEGSDDAGEAPAADSSDDSDAGSDDGDDDEEAS